MERVEFNMKTGERKVIPLTEDEIKEAQARHEAGRVARVKAALQELDREAGASREVRDLLLSLAPLPKLRAFEEQAAALRAQIGA